MDPLAGRETADRWLQSQQTNVRVSGIDVLRDIGDAQARQRIQALTQDPDADVALAARVALDVLKNK